MKRKHLSSLITFGILSSIACDGFAAGTFNINGNIANLGTEPGFANGDCLKMTVANSSVGMTTFFNNDGATPISNRSIDLNGNNSTFNITNIIYSLGAVADNVGGGSLNINYTGINIDELVLTGQGSTLATHGIDAADNFYRNTNINFQNSSSILRAGDAAIGNPIYFHGSMTNASNMTMLVESTFAYRGNDTTFDFDAIHRSPGAINSTFASWKDNGQLLTVNSRWTDPLLALQPIRLINAATPMKITHASISDAFNATTILGIGDITNNLASEAILAPNADIEVFNIGFFHPDSTLTLDSSNRGAAASFQLKDTITGKAMNPVGFTQSDQDLYGKIRFLANSNTLDLIDPTNIHSLGSFTDRAQSMSFEGDSNITIMPSVFSQKLVFNNAGNTTLILGATMGASSEIDVQQDTTFIQGALGATFGSDTTIKLGNNNLNLQSGAFIFSGQCTINTEFKQSKVGAIDVGNGLHNTLFDISTATGVDLNFHADLSNIDLSNQITNNGEYVLPIITTSANGTFLPFAGNVNFTQTDNNLFVSWTYDDATNTVRSVTNVNGLAAALAPNAPAPAQQIVNAIVQSANLVNEHDPFNSAITDQNLIIAGNNAKRLIQFLGTLSPDELNMTLANINPQNTLENNREARDDSEEIITNRLISLVDMVPEPSSSNFIPFTINPDDNRDLFENNPGNLVGIGVASGDDLAKKYGVWFTPFYHKARQNQLGTSAGYKVNNFGGAFGVDTKISENSTVGFAWSHVKSILNHKNIKEGSKAVTNTDLFSLYGSVEFPNNYFLSGIGSYGISSINNSDKRILTSSISEYAKSKYKTKIYSAQILGGRNIPFRRRYYFTPLLGIKYAEFHDDAYRETGTRFQNYNVSKKKTSQLDLIAGTKLTYSTVFNDKILYPYISGMAFINLKDNPPTSYVTSDTFLNTVKLKGEKGSSKAWYSIGAGFEMIGEILEYALDYELQLDKEYVGHQGKIKVRVNF